MKQKHKYNTKMLKMGYEEMGKINLGFAESGCQGAAEDFSAYEQSLHDYLMNMEADGLDD